MAVEVFLRKRVGIGSGQPPDPSRCQPHGEIAANRPATDEQNGLLPQVQGTAAPWHHRPPRQRPDPVGGRRPAPGPPPLPLTPAKGPPSASTSGSQTSSPRQESGPRKPTNSHDCFSCAVSGVHDGPRRRLARPNGSTKASVHRGSRVLDRDHSPAPQALFRPPSATPIPRLFGPTPVAGGWPTSPPTRWASCTAPGFLDSGLTVFASTPPRPARGGRVAPGPGFGSRTSPASTARCTSA